MSEEPDQLRTALNWDVALQIERAVTEFEMAWRKGSAIEIEWVLQQNPTVPARELFCALLETELELRRLNGDTPDPKRWTDRFPQWGLETELIVAQTLPGESPAEDRTSSMPRAGEEFGRYRIVREVGRGAMGVVFQAQEITTAETVAIKVIRLPRSLTEDEQREAARRFNTEASATAALNHPNVIPVREVGDVEGVPYFTMPLIEGGTLKSLRREGPVDPVRAARIIEAAARALHHAHRSGLFHRDVKPSNILLGPGDRVFVTDFGVSLHRDELGRGPGIAGTPLYMSPEQSAGKSDLIDGRSDVFSLGIVLYELLTGAHPFDSPLAASSEIIERICHVPVPPLRQRSDIPRPLEDICLKALRRQPEDRYSTAGDFADDLRSFIDGATKPQRPGQSQAVERPRWPMIVGLVGVLLIGLAVALNSAMKPSPQTPLTSLPQSPDQTTTAVTPLPSVDPDRTAAEWLLSQKQTNGIRIWVRVRNSWSTQLVVPGESLPDVPFFVNHVQVLDVPAITGETIERFLVPLRDLENLELNHNRDLSSQDLVPVTRMKQLKSLGLTGTKVSGSECVAIFSKLPALNMISISSAQFSDDVAEFVRTTPGINQIWLHTGSERQVRQLLGIQRLTHVILFGSTGFVEADLGRDIEDRWPEMDNLGLMTMYLTDNDLAAIARLLKLKTLTLSESMFSDTGLLMLQTCTSLRDLSILRTKVTEASIRCLHARLPQCRIHWDGGVIEPTIRSQLETTATEKENELKRETKQKADDIVAILKQAAEPPQTVWESFRVVADPTLRMVLSGDSAKR